MPVVAPASQLCLCVVIDLLVRNFFQMYFCLFLFSFRAIPSGSTVNVATSVNSVNLRGCATTASTQDIVNAPLISQLTSSPLSLSFGWTENYSSASSGNRTLFHKLCQTLILSNSFVCLLQHRNGHVGSDWCDHGVFVEQRNLLPNDALD